MSLHLQNLSHRQLADQIDQEADCMSNAVDGVFGAALALGNPRFSEALAYAQQKAPEAYERYIVRRERHAAACREGVRRVGPMSCDMMVAIALRDLAARRVA